MFLRALDWEMRNIQDGAAGEAWSPCRMLCCRFTPAGDDGMKLV